MTDEEKFRALFRSAGLGPLLPEYEVEIKAGFDKKIDEVEQSYLKRYSKPANVRERCYAQPIEMAAFVQSVIAGFSSEICTMALRMLEGESLQSLSYEYMRLKRSHISITLTDGQTFESDTTWDSGVFRHFWPSETDGRRPVLDGYYAFNAEQSQAESEQNSAKLGS